MSNSLEIVTINQSIDLTVNAETREVLIEAQLGTQGPPGEGIVTAPGSMPIESFWIGYETDYLTLPEEQKLNSAIIHYVLPDPII
jgi:hypothetical protein